MRSCYLAWLLLASCNRVFTLDEHPDAAIGSESACPPLDEDGDCIANADDNCPGIANADQLDAGERQVGAAADGIGDACDPNPSLAGDRLVRFDAFDNPSDADAWIDYTVNGKWTFAPGEMRHPDTADNFASLQSVTPSASEVFAIEAGFRFAAWGAAARLGIIIDHADNTSPGHSCWATPDADAPMTRIFLQGDGSDEAMAAFLPTAEAGDRLRITLVRDVVAQRLACRAAMDPDRIVEVPMLAQPIVWRTDRYFSITAANTGATLRYVALYTR